MNNDFQYKQFDGFTKFCRNLAIGLPTVFLLVFLCCIFIKSKLILSPVSLISVFMIAAICFISKHKAKSWNLWLLGIFAASFLMRLIFIKIWPITPLSDCKLGYEMSALLAKNPLENWHEVIATSDYYYKVWPMHLPFIIYQTVCMRIMGESLFALQFANMFFSSLTCVFTAICAEGISKSKRVGIIAGLLMAFNVTTLFMACFLVNQHISTCFFTASLAAIIKKPFSKVWKDYILGGCLLAIGHLMRPEMYIIVIALVCVFVYELVIKISAEKSAKIWRYAVKYAGRVLSFILTFLVVINITNSVLMGLRWVKNPITESKLTYKLMIGLNQETEGRFKDEDYPLAANEIAVREVLTERISTPAKTLVLVIKKLCFQFTSYNYWWLQADKGGQGRQFVINHIFEPITQSYMFLVMLLAFLSALKLFKKHSASSVLLFVIYTGYLCAFSVMEVQQRYAYITVPVITILAAYSVLLYETKPAKKKKSVCKEGEGSEKI